MFTRRRLTAALTVLAVAMSLPGAGSGAEATVPSPGATPLEEPVTLITGDKVFVSKDPGGRPRVRLEPAPGRRHIQFFHYVSRQQAYVLPSDASTLVAQGLVDRRLFDVVGLLNSGYGDQRRKDLPLLVKQPGVAANALPSPAKVAKGQSADWWRSLNKSGATRVWLDGKVSLAIDQSVPHIGAPAAWQRGLTGEGVPVGILDTGYDTAHPDLAGAVVGARNFTNDPAGVEDNIGHGTHVASILAGRGSPHRGVAPGAKLLIGKVCANTEQSDNGPCPESAIIAGMAWAASQGARVVNLSLGGAPTDGTDPLSAAVNTLTERYGTLFVASSGNHAPWESGDRRISTPAAADAALAVASLSKTDQLSPFSNGGPRAGDFGLKPDLSAPGQDIVAARAAQGYLGEPVSEHYTRMSGTSMASPHVAGAAAILAGAHPGWRAAELKAALLSTSTLAADISAYAQGAGLVDVNRATGQSVWSMPGSLSMGYFKWPNSAPPPSSREVKYRNDTASPVTLALEVSGAVPAGLFNVDKTSITVPANGMASVNLTVTAQPSSPGLYAAQLIARSADGATVVRTTLGAYQEQESYDLDISTLDRYGSRPGQYQPVIIVMNLDTGATQQPMTADGKAKLRLPKGRYAVWSGILTGPTSLEEPSTTLAAEPEIQLTADTAVTFDARRAKAVTAQVDRADAVADGNETVGLVQTVAGEQRGAYAATSSSAKVFVLPTAKKVAGFTYFDVTQLREPEIRLSVPGRFSVPVSYVDVTYTPHFVGTETLVAVDGGKGTPSDLSKVDVRGRLVLLTLNEGDEVDQLEERVRDVAAAGGKAVQVTTWHSPRVNGPLALPTMLTDSPAGQRLLEAVRAGRVTVALKGIAASPYSYQLVLQGQEQIPATPQFRVRDRDLAQVRTRYAAQTRAGSLGTVAIGPNMSGWVAPAYLQLPMERMEFFSVGDIPGSEDPLQWHFDFRHQTTYDGSQPWAGWQMGTRGPYQAGKRIERINFGPFTPSVTTRSAMIFWRETFLLVEMPIFSASTPGHAGPAMSYGGDTGSLVLLRDGQEIARSEEPGSGFFEIGEPVPGRYEMRISAARSGAWTVLNTRATASWSFTWNDPSQMPPLTALRFSALLDEQNQAPAGQHFPLLIRADQVVPSELKQLTMQVSYDDGVTWAPASLNSVGGQWVTVLKHPAGAKFVSLRASATDAAGNSVTQEVIRAYALR